MAVLQLIERRAFTLDTPAHTLIDPVLQSQCGYSMRQRWQSAAIERVTVRQLLQMTSGVVDYDGTVYQEWTLLFGTDDDLLCAPTLRHDCSSTLCHAVDPRLALSVHDSAPTDSLSLPAVRVQSV